MALYVYILLVAGISLDIFKKTKKTPSKSALVRMLVCIFSSFF